MDKDVNNYTNTWLTSSSPKNYPQDSSGYDHAGSIVDSPFVEIPQNNPSVHYLQGRNDITYSCIVICDSDTRNPHGGKDGKPFPHWNFKVVQTIKISPDKSRTREYKVPHNRKTNVPKSKWIDVEIEINGFKHGKRRYFWDST